MRTCNYKNNYNNHPWKNIPFYILISSAASVASVRYRNVPPVEISEAMPAAKVEIPSAVNAEAYSMTNSTVPPSCYKTAIDSR